MAASTPTVGVAVINPENGPGNSRQTSYSEQAKRSREADLTVLGYVSTRYGERDPVEVRVDVDRYYEWYGVDGIFFDEASTDCAKAAYYTQLTNHVKTKDGESLTVLNPGTSTDECYMPVADVLVTFEDTYAAYAAGYSAPRWVSEYPSGRFWHLIHSAPDTDAMTRAVSLSKERNAGYVYVTPDAPPNPWDTLPPERYWKIQISAVAK